MNKYQKKDKVIQFELEFNHELTFVRGDRQRNILNSIEVYVIWTGHI